MKCNFDAKKLGEQVTEKRDRLWEIADIINQLRDKVTIGRWHLASITDTLRVRIDPGQRESFRAEMKSILGTWGDKMVGVRNITGDWIQVDYESTTAPIEFSIDEDAKTIDLADYGLRSCSLQEHIPEYRFQEKWSLSCPKEEDTDEKETDTN